MKSKIELESMFDNAQTMHLQEFINYYTPDTTNTGTVTGGEGYTKGKWEYTELKGIKEFCIHSGGDQICYTDKMDSEQTQEANANRIVQAVNNFDAMYNFIKEMATRYEKSEWIAGEANKILNNINQL